MKLYFWLAGYELEEQTLLAVLTAASWIKFYHLQISDVQKSLLTETPSLSDYHKVFIRMNENVLNFTLTWGMKGLGLFGFLTLV